MTILSPVHSSAQKMGAHFVELAGWQVAQRFGTDEEESAAIRERVGLADLSARGKIVVEGRDAAKLLTKAWRAPALEIGRGTAAGPGLIHRLRPDRFFVSLDPGQAEAISRAMSVAATGFSNLVTVTDMTHGWAELLVVGPASRELLARLCGLDFRPDRFPDLDARQSGLAKTAQLIIRRDLGDRPAFALIGGRSLAAYLWETILEAGRDLGIRPVGTAALTG